MQLLLASASPRRRLILDSLGLPYRTVEVGVDEHPQVREEPEALARRLAAAKAHAAALAYPSCVALGADTVVALGRHSLGKPGSANEATQMLQRLRGRPHRVITSVVAAQADEKTGAVHLWERTNIARVKMRRYSDEEIRDYVASGDPLDKAGAYAIQHPIFQPVVALEGCYLTVVGLPLPETLEVLALAGVPSPPIDGQVLEDICPSCPDKVKLLARPIGPSPPRSFLPSGENRRDSGSAIGGGGPLS